MPGLITTGTGEGVAAPAAADEPTALLEVDAAVAAVPAALLEVAAAVAAALVAAALVAGAALDATVVAVASAALAGAAVVAEVVTAAAPPQAERRPTDPLTTRERQVRRDNLAAYMDRSFAVDKPALRLAAGACPGLRPGIACSLKRRYHRAGRMVCQQTSYNVGSAGAHRWR
jgi:hypothetical protein